MNGHALTAKLASAVIWFGFLLLNPAWAQAPRKAQIVFTSDREGTDEIYIMDTDGRNLHRLTDLHLAGYPAWS